jgi:SNF2 family DNA or RNA helicase
VKFAIKNTRENNILVMQEIEEVEKNIGKSNKWRDNPSKQLAKSIFQMV